MNADDLTFEEIGQQRFDLSAGDDEEYFYGGIGTNGSTVTSTSAASGTASTTGTTIGAQGPSGGTYKVNAGSSTQTYTISVNTGASKPATKLEVFDLAEMGITQEGTFDSSGNLVGWVATYQTLPHYYPSFMQSCAAITLGASPDFVVLIRGIFSRYYTNERRAAMGLQPL